MLGFRATGPQGILKEAGETMAQERWERFISNLGVYVYGLAAIALGVLGLIWGDFATNWQRVPADIPHHLAVARAAAIYELVAGVGMLWRGTRRVSALLLTGIYTVFVLLWVDRVVAHPLTYDNWGNVFEELSLVAAGMIVYASQGAGMGRWRAAGFAINAYGVCVVSFALVHIIYLPGAASFVPKWIPLGGPFWAGATAICFMCAAAAIFAGLLASLATRLLTLMIALFGLLVWLPMLIAQPHVHFIWSGNAINFALLAAAWVVADYFAVRDRQRAAARKRLAEVRV